MKKEDDGRINRLSFSANMSSSNGHDFVHGPLGSDASHGQVGSSEKPHFSQRTREMGHPGETSMREMGLLSSIVKLRRFLHLDK
jgi:hypothetical protein